MSNQGTLAWWRRAGPVSYATAMAYRLRHGAPDTSTGDVTSFGLCRCPSDASGKAALGTRETRRVGSHFLPGTLLPSNRPPPPSFAPPPASSNTWFRRLPGPGRGDFGARAQPLHSQVVPGARAQGARGGLQDARAMGEEEPRGPRWVCAGLERAGSEAARRSWGHGRHLACPGNSGRWPAILMGLRRRASNRDFNAAWCRDVLVFYLFIFYERADKWLRKMSLLFVVKHCFWIRLYAIHFSGQGWYNLDSDSPLGIIMLASAMQYCWIMEKWEISGTFGAHPYF